MKKSLFTYILIVFIALLLQATVFNNIIIFGIRPNIVLILVISIAIVAGSFQGSVVGFFSGFFMDIFFTSEIGFYSLLMLYTGLIAGIINKKMYKESVLIAMFLTFLLSIVYEILVYFLGIFILGDRNFVFAFREIIIIEALINSILAIFVYIFVVKLSYKMKTSNEMKSRYR